MSVWHSIRYWTKLAHISIQKASTFEKSGKLVLKEKWIMKTEQKEFDALSLVSLNEISFFTSHIFTRHLEALPFCARKRNGVRSIQTKWHSRDRHLLCDVWRRAIWLVTEQVTSRRWLAMGAELTIKSCRLLRWLTWRAGWMRATKACCNFKGAFPRRQAFWQIGPSGRSRRR